LQLVAGADLAALYRPLDPWLRPRLQPAGYVGAHLLLPAIDRLRIEVGAHPTPSGAQFGFSVGFYEKSFMQRMRAR
ncbi:MAG: hypothetical protein ACK4N5_25775, partial [Myxococcales bacterium]